MVKKFSALLIALCVVFTMFAGISVSAADQFECTYRVDYENSVIYYEITTPARYRQLITVTLSNGDTHDNVVRVDEVRADINGKASGSFQMTTGDDMGTYVLKASGAGYLQNVSNDSDDVYYENHDDIYKEGGTLDRFNSATVDTIGDLLLEKKGMFDYDFGADSDYEKNSALIQSMFIAIRTDDYAGVFDTFTEVLNTMNTVSAIREFSFMTSPALAEEVCENMASLLGIDLEDEDYKGYEKGIYTVFLPNFKDEPSKSIAELKKCLQQSIGIAKLNRVDAEEATDVVREYGELIGIDVSEYEEKIVEYDETQFNYAFVGMNYTTAKQVVAGYEERKQNPPTKAEKPSDGTGGGPGGGPSGSKKPETPYNTIEITGKEEENTNIQETLTDMSSEHWAYEAVKTLGNAGVINGFEDGTFRPEDVVTREQFIKMLVAAFEMKADSATCSYSDVPKAAWYYESVAIATEKGITKGYGNTFGTGTSITREDAAVMIYRIIEAAQAEAEAFSDDSVISSYAKDAVYALAGNGVINGMGDGSFAPKASLTRAQAAKIIFTALKYKVAK